jgi:hypothetical protein
MYGSASSRPLEHTSLRLTEEVIFSLIFRSLAVVPALLAESLCGYPHLSKKFWLMVTVVFSLCLTSDLEDMMMEWK